MINSAQSGTAVPRMRPFPHYAPGDRRSMRATEHDERPMLTKPDKIKLFTLMGSYPNAMALEDGRLKPDLVEFDSDVVKVSSPDFKPLVREARFDLAEIAIVT